MTGIYIDWEKEAKNYDLECPNDEQHRRFSSGWAVPPGSTTDHDGNPCEPYEGCPTCEDDRGYLEPMLNYGYVIDYDGMITREVQTKIASETACILVHNNNTNQWFITQTGGGMDLSAHIAYAYVLAQKWLPLDLLDSIGKGNCKLELNAKQFKMVSDVVKEQTKMMQDRFATSCEAWNKA